ncbi:MAG: hypothetical protein V4608_09870 [Bacteroidota bacterium]
MKKVNENQPMLINCMEEYLEYLTNENLPVHQHQVKNRIYINKVDRYFRYYLEALKLHSVDVELLKFTDIDAPLVTHVHDYALNMRNFTSSTYNQFISVLKKFTDYIEQAYELNYQNPFSKIHKDIFNKDNIISREELLKLVEIVTPENSNCQKWTIVRNIYKPWFIDAYWLGLLTGARKTEIVNFKWSDIKVGSDKQLQIVRINSGTVYKRNVSSELKAKLDELGYEEYKNSDNFILAPQENIPRIIMAVLIAKSFAHYAKLIGMNKVFNGLRGAYIFNCIDTHIKGGGGNIYE